MLKKIYIGDSVYAEFQPDIGGRVVLMIPGLGASCVAANEAAADMLRTSADELEKIGWTMF